MATQKEVIRVLQKTAKSMEQTLLNKGVDYSGKEDTFKNFKSISALVGIPVETVILSRMTDKISRLSNVLKEGSTVGGETELDTIDDLIGYAILLKAYREEKMVSMRDIPELAPATAHYIVDDDDGEID